MSNNKSKGTGNVPKKEIKKYIELLYMTPTPIKAIDLHNLLQNEGALQVDLWAEMNVLEIELKNGNSVDFEPIDVNFKDPSDASFVKNRKIQTIFSIQLVEDDLDSVKSYFDKIVESFSGFVCMDSDNFQPVYSGSSNL